MDLITLMHFQISVTHQLSYEARFLFGFVYELGNDTWPYSILFGNICLHFVLNYNLVDDVYFLSYSKRLPVF